MQKNVITREKCQDCWAKFLCGGECYHRALIIDGNPHSAYDKGCERRKELFRQCLYMYHEVKETDPEAWDWYFSVNLYP
jgi:uncharacterized protein